MCRFIDLACGLRICKLHILDNVISNTLMEKGSPAALNNKFLGLNTNIKSIIDL